MFRIGQEGGDQVKQKIREIGDEGEAVERRLAEAATRRAATVEQIEGRLERARADLQKVRDRQAGFTEGGTAGLDAIELRQRQEREGAQRASDYSRDLEQNAAAAQRLIAAMDPLYAAQQRYGAKIAEITALRAAGALTEQRYIQLMQSEDDALDRATLAHQRYGDAMRAGGSRSIMAAQQAQDFFIQVQGGGNILLAASQQLSQYAFIMQDAEGKAGNFARFMAGGWGTAILVGAMALAPLIQGLFDTRTELQKATDELVENARKAEITRQAHEAFANSIPGIIASINSETDAVEAQNRTLEDNQRLRLATIGMALQDAQTARPFIEGRLNAARAGEYGSMLSPMMAQALGQQLDSLDRAIIRGQRGQRESLIPIMDRQVEEQLNKTTGAAGRLTRQIRELQREFTGRPGIPTEAEQRAYQQRLTPLRQQLEALQRRGGGGGSGGRGAAQQARNAASMEVDAQGARSLARAYLESASAALTAEARREGLTDATRRGIDADAQMRRQLDLNIAEIAVQGAQQVRQLEDETSARRRINGELAAGTITVEDMNLHLQEEARLRPLLQAQLVAQGDEYQVLTEAIDKYRAALVAAEREAINSEAIAGIYRLRAANDNTRALFANIGMPERERAMEDARLRAEAEARQKRYEGPHADQYVDERVREAQTAWEGRAREELARTNEGYRERNALLQYELGLGVRGVEQRERMLRLEALRLQYEREFGPLGEEQVRLLMAQAEAQEDLTRQVERTRAAQQELEQVGGQLIDEVFNIDNWDDWGAAGKRVIQMLLQELITLAAVNPLKNMLFGQNNPTAGGVLGAILGGVSKVAGGLSGGGAGGGDLAGLHEKIWGNATGTQNFTGGMTWIAENGPELVNLPRGSKITPAAETRRLLAANDGGRAPFIFAPDMRGAVMTEDLLRQMQEMASKAASDGAQGGASMIMKAHRDSHGRLFATR